MEGGGFPWDRRNHKFLNRQFIYIIQNSRGTKEDSVKSFFLTPVPIYPVPSHTDNQFNLFFFFNIYTFLKIRHSNFLRKKSSCVCVCFIMNLYCLFNEDKQIEPKRIKLSVILRQDKVTMHSLVCNCSDAFFYSKSTKNSLYMWIGK